MNYDDKGRERPDTTPVEVPVRLKRPQTIEDRIRAEALRIMSSQAAESEQETFEEANDFET